MQTERNEDEKTAAEPNQEPDKTDLPAGDHIVGAFGGKQDHVVRTREGEPSASDTGDQGGGQN
jgi:hypothetical protein